MCPLDLLRERALLDEVLAKAEAEVASTMNLLRFGPVACVSDEVQHLYVRGARRDAPCG
jgi:hypothetical protein